MKVGTEKLYNKLRDLVSDSYAITIVDKTTWGSIVAISPIRKSHPWTRFEGKNIRDSLKRAINKFQHPKSDYEDITGYIWRASESSIYDENHIRIFLRKGSGVGDKTKENSQK